MNREIFINSLTTQKVLQDLNCNLFVDYTTWAQAHE